MRAWLLAILAIASLAVGCSESPKPPEGRWQALYIGNDVMIAARVEIGPDGRVRLSAPNASLDFGDMMANDRLEMQTRLTLSLAVAWPKVAPREFDFDGRVFRNPGGVAPQLEWDAKTRRMTMFVYRGSKPTVRVDMEPVEAFAD